MRKLTSRDAHTFLLPTNQPQRHCQRQRPGGGGAPGSRPLFWGPTTLVLLSLGIEEADKFKPTTSRPPALHLRFYSSVSVWRGTEGGGVDAHRKRHLNQDYLTPSNKGEGAYGCCLDLLRKTLAKFRVRFACCAALVSQSVSQSASYAKLEK